MRQIKKLSALFAIILLVACNRSSNQFPVFHEDYVKHISAYTSGVVDRAVKLRIVLAHEVKDYEDINPAKTELFNFNPEISGQWHFEDSRTIVFIPNEELIGSTIYQAVFHLGEVKKVDRELRRFPFRFETRKQVIQLHAGGLNLYPDNHPRFMYLLGSVTLNDRDNMERVEQCLTAFFDSKQHRIKWTPRSSTSFDFRIDSLERGEFNKQLKLKLNGKPIGAQEKTEREFRLSGLGDFKLASTQIKNEPDQIIHLFFSDAISILQNLKGLIKFDGSSDVNYELNGNKITIYPKDRLTGEHTVELSADIQNFMGYKLKTTVTKTLFFQDPKPKLRMVGNGTIVPDAKGVVFPFEAMALKAVDVWVYKIYEKNIAQFLQINDLEESGQLQRVGALVHQGKVDLNQNKKVVETQWMRYTLNLGNYINKEPGAIYRVMIGFRKSYTFFECDENDEDHGTDTDAMYYSYYSNNNSTLQNYSPCDASFYYSGAISRNILTSDIGLIVKSGTDGLTHVFASNLITAKPENSAKIQFYTYQNSLIRTSYTDTTGMTTVKLNEDPFLLVATVGKQKGYLKLGQGRNNSTSTFDVDGINVGNGVEGRIYAERGVWRPGDSMYVCFVLHDETNKLPKNVPVSFKLTDPRGKTVKTHIRTNSVDGVYDFRTKTEDESPTGNYRVEVVVGGESFYKTLPVETVQPNRLKIKWESDDSVLSVDKNSQIRIEARWLHGAISPGLKYSVVAKIRKIKTVFKGYEDYSFDDDSKQFSQQERIVAEGSLDSVGRASFIPDFDVNQQVPGKLKVDFLSKVFEKSGNFSTDFSSFELSPYLSYVGIKEPKTDDRDDALETDKTHIFRIAHVDGLGKKMNGGKLSVKIYRIEWRWWWESHRNLASYMQSKSLIPIVDSMVTSTSGEAQMKFQMPYPNWGRFLMVVKDPKSGHSSSKVFYVDWPYWRRANRTDSEQAVTLQLLTGKSTYQVGQNVQVSIPTTGKGKALVCIENGTSVIQKFWIDTKKEETRLSFKATSEMAPNVYVHVSYLQPFNQSENDLPARLFGIIPVKVENPASHLNPVIKVADEIRPDQFQSVRIEEKNGRAMTYTLAVVDEGLLDLTHFKTPDLWSHFYQKRSLGVRTWDLYDEVLGNYEGKWGNVLSVGGDEGGNTPDGAAHKSNRFVPAIKFLGPFHLKPGQHHTHNIKMGMYVGAVRMMVVARLDNAYGSAYKSVKVKKPIMVLTTLPRILTPGEEIAIPVNVFNMDEKSKTVTVNIKSSGNLTIIGQSSKTIEFATSGDEIVTFRGRVKEKIGKASVSVEATDGHEKAKNVTDLMVRTPNKEKTTVEEYVIKSGESEDFKVNFNGLEGTNSGKIEVSGLPPVNLWQRVNELIQYPHGCVEQTTSSVFAQLFLDDFVTLDAKQKSNVENNINAAIRRLSLFQTSDGGLGYWPGSRHTSPWGTNYAGHFLTIAKNEGYFVDDNFYNGWLNFQKEKAKEYAGGNATEQLIQSYRLYTLALSGNPEIASMNRMRESKDLYANSRWRLAAAYVMAGMPETARLITTDMVAEVNPYTSHGPTFGSSLRDKALLLETLVAMGDEAKGMALLKDVSESLAAKRWLSTQETAYSLIALAGFHKRYSANAMMSFTYTRDGQVTTVKTAKPYSQINMMMKSNATSFATTIKNKGEGPIFIRVIKSGVPLQTDTNSSQKNIKMSISYVDFDGKEIDPSRLAQGKEFKIRVMMFNPGSKGVLREMALNQLLPGGWEIQQSRLYGIDDQQNYTYRDVRDDRVYTYFDLKVGGNAIYELTATATYAGRFYLPAQTTECMYDHSVEASIPGRWVEVISNTDELVAR